MLSLAARRSSRYVWLGLSGVAALAAAFADGCGEAADPSVDAAPFEASGDASTPGRHTPRDAAPDAAEAGIDRTFRLVDGGVVRGPVAAVFDHTTFWDASAEKTYAVFERPLFGPYPDDRSLHFLSSTALAAPVDPPPSPSALPDPTFREFLRAEGIVLFRPPLAGVSFVIRGNDGYHLEENGYGQFAWDLVKTKADGSRFRGAGAANEDYDTWDQPVVLPSAGYVVEVVRDAPDNVPGSYAADAVNNMVGVWLGGHYYVYILHFRQNSIPSQSDGTCDPKTTGIACVRVGAWLPTGTYLGRAGNSGVSLEPHVHVTLLYYNLDTLQPRTWGVPGEFTDLHVGSSPTGPSKPSAYVVPKTGDYLSAGAF